MKMIKLLDLHAQYLSIQDDIDQAIASVIRDSAFIRGKYLDRFEEHFAAFQQAEFCIGVGNGTDALEIAIEALGLPKGSEIIVPGNSFIASSEAVTRSGHRVVFCDAHADDYTIDIHDVKKRITAETSAVMAVHLYGHPCDMDALLEIARKNGLRVIEDCAQAHGAEYKGRRVGTIGDIGTFSFFPGKNLGAYGDGGAIVVDSPELAKKCRMVANHGRNGKYDHEFEGRNSRLDGLQAAILDVKLRHLEQWTEHRIQVANTYLEVLSGASDIKLPVRQQWARQVYHQFIIRSPQRDNLRQRLAEEGVQTGVHYPTALPKLPAYQYCQQSEEKMQVNRLDQQLLSLPIGEHIQDASSVASLIKSVCNEPIRKP